MRYQRRHNTGRNDDPDQHRLHADHCDAVDVRSAFGDRHIAARSIQPHNAFEYRHCSRASEHAQHDDGTRSERW